MEALLKSRGYVFERVLGVGSFGTAVLCTHNNEHVVVKQVRILEAHQQEAENEVKIMQSLDHLNVCRYVDCFKQDNSMFIVMEHCERGELAALISRRAAAKQPFSEQEVMFMFTQIALALWHVHSQNILHRDLKTSNVFVCTGNILKLGDFGIARVLTNNSDLAKTAIGTPFYLSPEICQNQPYNRKSDVWALGCLLYELAALRLPFDGSSLPALMVRILRGQYTPLSAGQYSSQLRGLVDAMLQQEPKARPSVDAILRMDYVKQHLARYAQHVMQLAQQPSGHRHFPWLGTTAEPTPAQQASVPDAAAAVAHSSFSVNEIAGLLHSPSAAAAVAAAAAASRTKQADLQHQVAAAAAAAGNSLPDAAQDVTQSAGESADSNMLTGELPSRDSSQESSTLESSFGSACSGSDSCCCCSAGGQDSEQQLHQQQHQQQQHHGRGLVGTGWLEQQQAVFAQLQADLAASPGFAHGVAAAAAPEAAAVTPAVDPLGLQTCLQQQQQQNDQLSTEQASPLQRQMKIVGATPSSSKAPQRKPGCSSSSRKPTHSNSSSSRKPQKHAASPADVVAAARASRQAEKQAWQQHQAKAAAEDAARRAARAAELEVAIKEKQEQQRQQQQEGAVAAAAHRQHMQQVKPRLDRAQLAELGAAFKQRLEAQFTAVAKSAVGQQRHASPALPAAASAALPAAALQLVPLSAGGACVAAAQQVVGGDEQLPGKGRENSSAGSSCSSSAAISAAASRRVTPDRGRAGRQGSSPLSTGAGELTAGTHNAEMTSSRATVGAKPWKVHHHKCSRSVEPVVEVFCPFGSRLEDQQKQQEQQQQQEHAELTFACNVGQQCETAAADVGSAHRMQQLLSQISSACTDRLQLPPETPAAPAERTADQQPQQQFAAPAGLVSVTQGTSNSSSSSTDLAVAGSAMAGVQMLPLAQRILALRCTLQEMLGADELLLACKYVEAVHELSSSSGRERAATDACGGVTDTVEADVQCTGNVTSGDSSSSGNGLDASLCQRLLAELLGPDKLS